jgi:opacity protein-like surface antigen
MKKLILAITTLALISTTAFAQDENMDRRDDLYLGAKVGGNYSNVYDTKGEEFDADPKIGLAFGAFISIPIGTYFGIQPEVMFSQKGFKGSGSVLGVNYEITRTTNYLDVPIYLQFKPSEFITFVAGPQYSYLLSRKDEFESDFGLIAQEEEFKNEDIRKNTLGASLGFDINLDNIVIGARAAWDLQDNKGDGTSSTPRYRNTLIQATIGLRF